MAHANINERREAVRLKLIEGKYMDQADARDIASAFDCSIGAIRADIIHFRTIGTNDTIHVSANMKKRIIKRDGTTCAYCKRKLRITDVIIEHIVPVSMGGCATEENLTVSCQSCNMRKKYKDGSVVFINRRRGK